MTWSSMLFYIIFAGQIFLMSYYIPRQLLRRMDCIHKKYPRSEYPKLYPKSKEYYTIAHWLFKNVYRGILVLGVIIFILLMTVVDHSTFADDGFISEFWPMLYGLIQFAPLLILEFSGYSQFKLMRQLNTSKTRKAELRPRRLFDFISPWLFWAAVLILLAEIVFDFYIHGFVVEWNHDTVQRTIVITVTNLFIWAVGAWNLYGLKQDPHQAMEDRNRQMKLQLTTMFYASILLSLFMMTQAADSAFDLDFLDAPLLSLYFQIIAYFSVGYLIRNVRLEDINFDVYKADAPMT